MKKVFKWILIVIGVIILFILLDLLLFMFTGHSWIGGDAPDTKQTEQLKQENTEGKKQDSDKPDDFIENIDLNQALQLAINNQGFLVGHLENADLAMDKKIANAQEVKDRVKPYRDTLLYLIQQDSDDGGEYDTRRMQIYYAVDYVYQMAQYSLDYFNSGSQEDLDDFYKYDDLAEKYIDLARENQQ